MNWFSTRAFEIGAIHLSFTSIALALGTMALGFALASRVTRKVRGAPNDELREPRSRQALAKISGYGIRLAAIALGLHVSGIDMSNVLAAGAVVAVGIGIAMQKVGENFVSGVILLAERSIREGDIIEFEGRIAKIRNMGIRTTIAQTLDDEEIIVPNSILTQSAVKNMTLTEHSYRLRVAVGVSYSADLLEAERALREAAERSNWRDEGREPVVLLTEFGSSSVNFEVSIWTRDVWGLRRGQSELRKAIWSSFKAASISIPFPQMDLHISKC